MRALPIGAREAPSLRSETNIPSSILLAIDDLAVEAEKSAQVLHEAQQLSRSATSLCSSIRKRLEPSTLGYQHRVARKCLPGTAERVLLITAASCQGAPPV